MNTKYFIILLLVFQFVLTLGHGQHIIYVQQHQKEMANGSLDNPFRNLDDALKSMARGNKHETTVIEILGGDYFVSNSILISNKHTSKVRKLLIIRAAKGESVNIIGGTEIKNYWFHPVIDKSFAKNIIDQSVLANIRVVDLKMINTKDLGEISRHGWSIVPGVGNLQYMEDRVAPATLYVGGKRMTLARWPNKNKNSPFMVYKHYLGEERPLKGYELKIQSIIDKMELPGEVSYIKVIDHGDKLVETHSIKGKGGTIKVAFDRMKYWHDIENIYLDGILSSTWEWTYSNLDKVDPLLKTITLTSNELSGLGVGESVRLPHFHFENIPEELDQPGEYFIDRKNRLLYYYPRPGDESSSMILTTLDEPMLRIEKADKVLIEGITFQYGRDLGVLVNSSSDITFSGCTIANFTKGGLSFTGEKLIADNCDIYGTGGFGIDLNGGSYKTLLSSQNELTNCTIHDFGWDQKSQMPGVFAKGVGHRISNNEIYDGTHFGIRLFRTNDVVIEYNEIYDLPKYHLLDGGALYIYNGPRAAARGNVVRYNHFHDIPTIGVYPDNFSSGILIYNNLFENVGLFAGRAPVMVNGGGDCKTYNNMMINCPMIYTQGARPMAGHWMKHWNRALVWFGNGKIENSPYAKYDDFRNWLEKKSIDEFYRPVSYVYDNILVNTIDSLKLIQPPNGIIDRSGTLEDNNNWITYMNAGIADRRGKNYNIKSDTSIFNNVPNFNPIPVHLIGPNKQCKKEKTLMKDMR